MNTKELAKQLEVSENTLRLWEKELDINVKRGTQNRRKYDENTILIFEKIKELRDQNSGFATIRKTIKPTTYSNDVATSELHSVIRQELKEHTELAEKYAKATYQIGMQEERVKTLLQERSNLQITNEKLKSNENILTDENNSLKRKIELLKIENEYLKQPWWKKIFKRVDSIS